MNLKKKYKNEKKTSVQWQEELGIKIKNPYLSWKSKEDFENKFYDIETFMNLASHCEIEKPKEISRRDAAKMKNELKKKVSTKKV